MIILKFLVDKTPTPSRLIRNLEEVGLFDENIFDVTFRKAIEEKDNPTSTSSLRRMISIQNEDTLHTPHIPLHLYKSSSIETTTNDSNNSESNATGEIVVLENKTKTDLKTTELKTVSVDKEKILSPPTLSKSPKKRLKRKKLELDQLLLPPPSCSTSSPVDNTPSQTEKIQINFPDEIRIQPKWTVMLQYPAYETTTTTTTVAKPQQTVKERLHSLLVKNESGKMQTITLTPPPPTCETSVGVISKNRVINDNGNNIVGNSNNNNVKQHPQPILTVFTEEEEKDTSKKKDPEMKKPRSFSQVESNLAAVKRYRAKKKDMYEGLRLRNEQLEEENRRLRSENRELKEKLRIALG